MNAPMHILIADDDKISTLILSAALKDWNFVVSVVHDGADAWRVLVNERPAMAILDWMMPSVDGPTLCRQIRARPDSAGTYVMLLTSRDARSDLVAGLDAGADDYLTKPVDREELRARVHVGIRVASLQSRLSDQVEDLQKALAQVKQLEGLLRICSYCKSIRGDGDSWLQLERYIANHSKTEFSHGICPDCFERVKQDFEG